MRIFNLFFALLFAAGAAWAQTPEHSSIQKLEASYHIKDASAPVMLVTQHLHVVLKANADVQKINLRVKDAQTGTLVYEVSYSGNDPQTGPDGLVLFSRSGIALEIFNPTAVPLLIYTYELSTENSTGQVTELFTDNQ